MSELIKNVYDVTNITTMRDYPTKTDKSIIIYATDNEVYFMYFGKKDNVGRSDFKSTLPTLYEAYKTYFHKDNVDDTLVEKIGYIAEKSLCANHEATWHKCLYIFFTPHGVFKDWEYDSLKNDTDINIRGKVSEKILNSIENNTHPFIKNIGNGVYDARESKCFYDDVLLLDKKGVVMVLFNNSVTNEVAYYINLSNVEGKTTYEKFQSIGNILCSVCGKHWEIALPNRKRFIEDSYLFIYGNSNAYYSNSNGYVSRYKSMAIQGKGATN